MQARFMERREKRPLDSSSNDDPDHSKRPALASVIVEALKVDSLQKLCSSLEPILRRIVSEELERALAKLGPAKLTPRSSPKRIKGCDGRKLQLHFRSRLSLPLFTGGKIEGEQGSVIQIVLIDASSRRVVTTGPESSARLDVVVVEGDFNNEDDENWTEEEFESHLVKERDGKRPLLTGDLQVTLKDGVGTLGELTFTDNSSWIRSRKFRLGLKVASGCCDGIRIREAKTDAFTVKDHRGELYKKHYPPAPNDEVWRLEKIGKDGSFHKRLNKAGIYTVEEFLSLVARDSQKLRNILGSGMSNKMWDVLIEHAKTCVLSGKLYVYYPEDAKDISLVFNHICEFRGLIANGQFYSADSLTDDQKVNVDGFVKKAYENWMFVVEFDGQSLLDVKQDQALVDSENEFPTSQQEFLNSYDHQNVLPSITVPDLTEQPPISTDATIAGYEDTHSLSFATQLQNGNFSTPFQFDATNLHLQNPAASDLQQFPRSDNYLSLAPSQSGFQDVGMSNLCPYRGANEFFPEEEILGNGDMHHYHRMINTNSQVHPSYNVADDSYPYSSTCIPTTPYPNYSFSDDDQSRTSSKAVVGWLKLKAALRWGVFVRKKAAEKRAQLVELDDS